MCEYEPSDVHMTNELFEGMEKLLQKVFTMSGIFGMRNVVIKHKRLFAKQTQGIQFSIILETIEKEQSLCCQTAKSLHRTSEMGQ